MQFHIAIIHLTTELPISIVVVKIFLLSSKTVSLYTLRWCNHCCLSKTFFTKHPSKLQNKVLLFLSQCHFFILPKYLCTMCIIWFCKFLSFPLYAIVFQNNSSLYINMMQPCCMTGKVFTKHSSKQNMFFCSQVNVISWFCPSQMYKYLICTQ